MTGKPDVVVAGHLCLDLFVSVATGDAPLPGRIVEAGPIRLAAGGCVANVGQALGMLGASVVVDADIGADDLGRLVLADLGRAGVEWSGVRRHDGVGTSYSVVLEPPGVDRSIWHHPGANDRWDGRATTTASASILHVGYPPILPATYADGGRSLRELFATAHGAGTATALDLATPDPAGPSGAVDWDAFLGAVLPEVDVFCPSVDDLRVALRRDVSGFDALVRLADELLALGPSMVMLKAGRSGLYLRTGDAGRFAASPVMRDLGPDWHGRRLWAVGREVEVHATTGAGDAAAAGLLYAVARRAGVIAAVRGALGSAVAWVAGARPLPTWAALDEAAARWPTLPPPPTWVAAGQAVFEPVCAP